MKPQPTSEHCFICGRKNQVGLKLTFYSTAPGEVAVDYTVPEHYQGYPGVVHGGIVAAILDETAGRSLLGNDRLHPRFMYTARLTIRYRKPVPTGQPLHIVGRLVKDRKYAAVAASSIYGPQGDLLAEAEALMMNIPEEMLAGVDLTAMGWATTSEG